MKTFLNIQIFDRYWLYQDNSITYIYFIYNITSTNENESLWLALTLLTNRSNFHMAIPFRCIYMCVCTHIHDYALRQQTTTHFTFHFQCIEFDLSYWHKLHEWGSICASTYLILHPPIFLTFFFTYIHINFVII